MVSLMKVSCKKKQIAIDVVNAQSELDLSNRKAAKARQDLEALQAQRDEK